MVQKLRRIRCKGSKSWADHWKGETESVHWRPFSRRPLDLLEVAGRGGEIKVPSKERKDFDLIHQYRPEFCWLQWMEGTGDRLKSGEGFACKWG